MHRSSSFVRRNSKVVEYVAEMVLRYRQRVEIRSWLEQQTAGMMVFNQRHLPGQMQGCACIESVAIGGLP